MYMQYKYLNEMDLVQSHIKIGTYIYFYTFITLFTIVQITFSNHNTIAPNITYNISFIPFPYDAS